MAMYLFPMGQWNHCSAGKCLKASPTLESGLDLKSVCLPSLLRVEVRWGWPAGVGFLLLKSSQNRMTLLAPLVVSSDRIVLLNTAILPPSSACSCRNSSRPSVLSTGSCLLTNLLYPSSPRVFLSSCSSKYLAASKAACLRCSLVRLLLEELLVPFVFIFEC